MRKQKEDLRISYLKKIWYKVLEDEFPSKKRIDRNIYGQWKLLEDVVDASF
jgi:hypothetical protein